MGLKFPLIDFESDHWPIKTLHNTSQVDWHFTVHLADFESKDHSFRDVMRCLIAEMILKGKPKNLLQPINAFRMLKITDAHSVFNITLNNLRTVENACLNQARVRSESAPQLSGNLSNLQKHIDLLRDKEVIPPISYRLSHQVKAELSKLSQYRKDKSKADRAATLDLKIEAFNDALNALVENDPRLSAADRVAIAALTRSMCAPSRINEILCSSIDDHVVVEDYAERLECKETDEISSAHQMLLITMKGSKGAQWGAKPALNFMIDSFNYATEIIKQHGQRSRMLVEWYQQHPNTLYLPPELERLRGKNLSAKDLANIVHLTDTIQSSSGFSVAHRYFKKLQHKRSKGPNPDKNVQCGRGQPQKSIWFLPFEDVEQFLLEKVRKAMHVCRKVTRHNHYNGDLSKMLFLTDQAETPYLPGAANSQYIDLRLKGRKTSSGRKITLSLFEKLGITMPVNGKVQVAKIDTHDPRRWLTTMALRHGEKLSDVLINKWANRLNLAQLKAYDMRPSEELATSSSMPEPVELKDITRGINQARKLEEEFGLKSEIVTVHDAGISVASMDKVLRAVEDRPIARTSEQIIICYPSRYGVCFQQHHETPCRNYDSCLPCDNNIVVKGHLPTNDEVRRRNEFLHKSIVRQIDRLAREHNRDIADDPHSLAHHMITLVEKGLNRDQMADYLIDEFHEIKHLIKDKLLAKRLEEAFVARGFVKRLENDGVPSGALMKYHNPTYHASPGLEKALDSHGGREQIARDEQALIERHPQFSPKTLGLKDERHLLEADADEDED
ncbi:MAG: hypothetical protein WA056_02505 [Gallionella sp.]